MTWLVYLSCGHELEVKGGPTPPYERGDGIDCAMDGRMTVQSIEAAVR